LTNINIFKFVTLDIYNITGERVRTLVCTEKNAVYHAIEWNGLDDFGQQLAGGLYFYSLKSVLKKQIKKCYT